MRRQRAVLAMLVGAILLSCTVPASGQGAGPGVGEPLTVYRLDPFSGWETLEQTNAYASAQRADPSAGWGNAAAVSFPVKATASFEPDTRRAELTVQFVPVSTDMRTNAGNLFVAPLGRRLEWKVIITVRNPNDIPMTEVKVRDEFGRAFRASLAGRPRGDARIEGDDPKARLPLYPILVWDIGNLGPGEAARAEVAVVTTRDRNGNMQFSQPGIYSIDTGAKLTYVLAGQPRVRNAECGSVIARRDMGALRSEGPPFDIDSGPIGGEDTGAGSVVPVLPPIVGDGPDVRAVVTRVAQVAGTRDISRPTSPITLVAAGVTSNITEQDGEFVVPPGEYAEWRVTVTIRNESNSPGWNSWNVDFDFGPELSVIVLSKTVPATVTGDVLTVAPTLPTDPVHVSWQWSGAESGLDFPQGSQAVAEFKVYTTSATGYGTAGEYVLTSDVSFGSTYPPSGSWGAWLSPIDVVVSPWANVGLSSTRLDWRVRKPGTYAALATEMSFTGAGRLTVDFSGFADLAYQDDGTQVIDTWYGFGTDLGAAEASGWIAADDLNDDANSRGPLDLDPTTPTTLRMWSKIAAGECDSSCEYEDQGVITFIVSNN